MKRILFLVAIAAMIAACNQPYGSTIPEKLVGNYHDINTKEWVYGLYEEFAIYQNDFWDYESASEKQIVLTKKTGEKVTLNLKSFDEWGEGAGAVFSMFVNGRQVCKTLDEAHGYMNGNIGAPFFIPNDTLTFKKHHYGIDSAVVRLYLRNTAKGIKAFANRELNREKHIQVLNYLESKDVVALPLDSTDHYGYRYEFKIPVTGVSELPMYDLFNHRFTGWNSTAGESMNYIVQPGDTLMFYAWEGYVGFSNISASGNMDCSGGSWRCNLEKTFFSGISLPDPNKTLEEPAYTLKFRQLYNRKGRYRAFLHFDQKSDTLKTIFPLNEDEIFSTITAYNFVINYILQNADTLSSTPENLAKHPDWIVAENEDGDTAKLLDPAFIKSLGLSDDFIEFFRLMHAVQFYDDFSPVTGLKDYELQSVMKNLTRDDYKRYLEDKMKKN